MPNSCIYIVENSHKESNAAGDTRTFSSASTGSTNAIEDDEFGESGDDYSVSSNYQNYQQQPTANLSSFGDGRAYSANSSFGTNKSPVTSAFSRVSSVASHGDGAAFSSSNKYQSNLNS